MQVVGSDKFKFFPVQFDKVIIPLGNIRSIQEERYGSNPPYVYVRTIYDESFRLDVDFPLAKALEIYKNAFNECEY